MEIKRRRNFPASFLFLQIGFYIEIQKLGITLENVCFVGDDVNDLDLLQHVGMAACPANAVAEVKAVPGIIRLTKQGGDGAIREVAEMILKAKS